MIHVRQSIRDNLVNAGTRLSTTGRNVFYSWILLLGTNKLPALRVFTDSETLGFTRFDPAREIDGTYRTWKKTPEFVCGVINPITVNF